MLDVRREITMPKDCEQCPSFLAISSQLDRVLNNQGKQFDKLDNLGKLSAVTTQRLDNHEKGHDEKIENHVKGHDRGFSRVLTVVMATVAILALGTSILIAVIK